MPDVLYSIIQSYYFFVNNWYCVPKICEKDFLQQISRQKPITVEYEIRVKNRRCCHINANKQRSKFRISYHHGFHCIALDVIVFLFLRVSLLVLRDHHFSQEQKGTWTRGIVLVQQLYRDPKFH